MSTAASPTDLIADLDAALVEAGRPFTLRRLVPGPNGSVIPSDVQCVGFLHGYAPSELLGGITQQDRYIVFSPSQINAQGWPGQEPAVPHQDPRVPRTTTDHVLLAETTLTVQAAEGIYVQGVLVRLEMRAKGEA